ncbi:MAG: restriction endonuclease subunit S [bacterium]|nr:restriction endonuclease subunit S [bacterium]
MITKFKTYPKYKNAGLAWAKRLPIDWDVVPMRSLMKTKKERVGTMASDYVLLSLTLGGVIPRDIEEGSGKHPADYDTYQTIFPDDLVMCLFDYDVTPRTVGHVTQKGIVTGAYTRLIPKSATYSKYYYYYFLWLDNRKELLHLCTGLRNIVSKHVFWGLLNPQPPFEIQKRIANFLDVKTKIIDELIAKKERLIELMRDKRSALITRAVTKGLNPNAKLKPSSTDWLGDIPAEWESKPLKFLFSYQAGGVWGDEERQNNHDIICIRVADFDFLRLITFSDEYTLRNLPQIEQHFLLDERSIMLEKSGGGDQTPVGRAVRYIGKEKATCSNFIQKLQVDDGFDPEFVVYLLSTLYFGGVTKKATKQTTGIQNLDLGYFFRTPVYYPRIEEQKEIANYIRGKLSNIVETIKKIESQIEKLKEYHSSLIYSAVTGKIKI